MQKIILGFHRFKERIYPKKKFLFKTLASKQTPEILFITCADSRVDPALITQTDPGELFVIRNAGNIVPPYQSDDIGVSASVEFAVNGLGVKHIIICGHSDCGAMKGVLKPSDLKNFPDVKKWIKYSAVVGNQFNLANALSQEEKLEILSEQNVLKQVENLKTFPYINTKLETNKLSIHGWLYDIGHCSIKVFSNQRKSFTAIEDEYSGLTTDGSKNK